jgi:hypothetical protein
VCWEKCNKFQLEKCSVENPFSGTPSSNANTGLQNPFEPSNVVSEETQLNTGVPLGPVNYEQLQYEFQRLKLKKYHQKDNIAFGIFLRFGSLTDDTEVQTSYEDIRYYTGIPQASMVRQIHKWRRLGKDINQFSTAITRSRWPLTKEMELWATSPEVLQQMATRSL